ncbi:EamA family transporter, partial [Rugamonas sp. FT82W]|nr:EamA family transporter [Duganella vulcania]
MDSRLRGNDGGRRLSDETTGMLLGLIAVAIFSLTLPFTRLAVGGGESAGGLAGAGLPP